MLNFLVVDRYPWREYLRHWGGGLRWHTRLISYEDIRDSTRLGDGAYIFGDIERMQPEDLAAAGRLWDLLLVRGDGVRLLNSPHLVVRRRALLRMLFESGINRFNVYGVEEEREAIRYPVFVRSEREHQGSYTPLLQNASELAAALEALRVKGYDLSGLLIVEFVDISSGGIFHKYSAIKLGATMHAQHLFFSEDWVVKASMNWSPENVQKDNAYLAENPHRDFLRTIFAKANIDYGRADYSLFGDQPQIWEINTNPTLLLKRSFYGPDRLPAKEAFSYRFNADLVALDQGMASPRLRDRIAGRLSLLR